jgi:hypothetical protein
LKRTLTVFFLAFLATSLIATSYALATSPSLTNAIFSIHSEIDRTLNVSARQGLTGSVTIANVSPVCSITGSAPATGPDLVIASSIGKIQVVALNWTLQNRCELIAPFQVTLSPGTYSLSLSSCSYIGCRVLPITVVVVTGVFIPVSINIVTGIY